MSALEQTCILSMSHRPLADLEFHRDWHKRGGCEYKAIWQTEEKTAPDWVYPIDVPGKLVIPAKMRIYCHYAKKFPQFKYFVFLDYDGFILDRGFVAKHIARMKAEKAQVLFTHLTDGLEHYKASYYGQAKKSYQTDTLVWSLNICTFVEAEAALTYDEKNDYKIYDEVDFACFARANFSCVVSDCVDPKFFTAGRAEGRLSGVKDGKFPEIVHAVKNYGVLAEVGLQ